MPVATLAVSSACMGCITYPSSDERFEDVIVVTRFAPGTEFRAFGTFAMAPAVDYVDATSGNPAPTPLDESVAAPLTNAVAGELASRNYEQVSAADNPELGAKIVVIKATVDDYTYAPVWGFDPFFWGYYYPYFVPVYYDYDTTFVRVDLIDVRGADPAELQPAEAGQLPAIWSTVVYGVLENTVAEETGQAIGGVQQAFEQSPYLRGE